MSHVEQTDELSVKMTRNMTKDLNLDNLYPLLMDAQNNCFLNAYLFLNNIPRQLNRRESSLKSYIHKMPSSIQALSASFTIE